MTQIYVSPISLLTVPSRVQTAVNM